MKINEWQPYNYIQRKTFHLLRQYPYCLIDGTWSKKVKEKLNLSLINANKYSFLSKRIRWVFFFCVCVMVDRDKVEVHKKTPKRLIFSLLDWTCLAEHAWSIKVLLYGKNSALGQKKWLIYLKNLERKPTVFVTSQTWLFSAAFGDFIANIVQKL